MTTTEISDQKLWDNFVTENATDTFLQSWQWGEFNKKLGEFVWRLGIYSGRSLVAVALVVKVGARRGRFLFVPHGPIIKKELSSTSRKMVVVTVLTNWLKNKSKETNSSFFRIASVFERNEANILIFRKLGYRNAPIHMHAEQSWILDITPDNTTLISQMRKTTRQIIRKEKQYQAEIKKSQNVKDIGLFSDLYNKSVKNRGFSGYKKKYLESEFVSFAPGRARLYFAYHNGNLLAAAFVILFGKSGFYHHGATNIENLLIPASHLLQWSIIQDLKKDGFQYYNFWGIAPEDKTTHPWRGLTLFKKGFGGGAKNYVKTQDYVVDWVYFINWSVETIRRFTRRY